MCVCVLQLATDPKLALQKAKELWASLSLPEPENQARPTNLEQLLVLFTRETARRIVHLVNGTANLAGRTPRRLGRALLQISHQLLAISEQALKVTNESLYRLLTDLLVLATSLLGYYQATQVQEHNCPPAESSPRKLHFQTNGGASGNGSSGNCSLSLIAKINIVPLARLSSLSPSSSPFIEELRAEDEDDGKDEIDGKAPRRDVVGPQARPANTGIKSPLLILGGNKKSQNHDTRAPRAVGINCNKKLDNCNVAQNGNGNCRGELGSRTANRRVDNKMPFFAKVNKPNTASIIIKQKQ